ncbi:Polysaccharide deacetylase [Gimesia chilikensis]|uniref:Polysaccharide deacetylase n=1 Tax=Gimesia chilikensis TaxID=2605989 RepID=A0A517WM67_9PLAN|nr:polysaccharide deacetylase family protein [Gimesia chilikensis]QDU06314.1 Polysaccharide deacetylase [Gimesia chilikensis]
MLHPEFLNSLSRRAFFSASLAAVSCSQFSSLQARLNKASKAQIAITFDLEMSRMYPSRDMLEWDYQKGNLNQETKDYSLKAAQIATELGGKVHYFCVGRVLEQKDVQWIKRISELGHPIGNHTYDHVNVWATEPAKTQFRFSRSPWLLGGKTAAEVIQHNVRITTEAMQQRLNIKPDGFRTPGGSSAGLDQREDLQKLLQSEGFQWVSSRYPRHKYSDPGTEPQQEIFDSILEAQRSAQPYVYPTGLVEIPMSPISDVGAFRTSRWKRKNFLKSVELCVQQAIEQKLVFDFLCHPSIMYVEDPDFETVKLICKLVRQAGDQAEIVGLSEIAGRYRKQQH